MATDPYGYADTSPASGGGDASTAMWSGVTAAMLGSVGICFCYFPYMIAFPLGAWAAWRGSQVIGNATDPRDRTMGTVALVSGGFSALVGGMFTLFWLMYLVFFALYFVIVMVAVAAGAAADVPPPP